jgi:sugar/nucleoside kinase (ribokinase family)
MRIGIIGAPCIDEIVHLDNLAQDQLVHHALGGILYSYCAMERIMREAKRDDRFLPLTWLAEPDLPLLNPILSSFRHMDREVGLWKTELPTNRVYLLYDERGERTADCPNVLPPLTERELTTELLRSLDALIINMISGHDVAIETLESALNQIPDERRPYVHLDLHALVQADLSEIGSTFGYSRDPRGVRQWKQWLALADSIQVNEVEARWFGDPEIQSEEELLAYVKTSRGQLRLQSLIITRAERGATLYDMRHDETYHEPIPALDIVEPTGSGDVFGTAYTYAIVNNTAPDKALKEAVQWATWNATLPSLGELLTTPR